MELFTFDDDYVRRLRECDRWTEEHFNSYFQQFLQIKLSRRLPSQDAIDDVRQTVFVRVYQALRGPDGGIRDGRKLGAYVNSFCTNVLREYYRTGNRTEPLTEKHPEVVDLEDVVKALLSAEEEEQVRLVLADLPKRDAYILCAHFYDQRHPDDVCRELGIDRGYLRVLLHRAKEKFRKRWHRNVTRMRSDETDDDHPSLPN
ncbi:MAG TPA: sigma-70 family RNA polymerase sigma factor [Thermoanaerobaculia bacterium]|jgi:RNA polymerase sigma-70 factor (ECF subfamily)|nr:sigma-70 family RNA polymerase sigma factor [Thermoanaerobaculia bacterium]